MDTQPLRMTPGMRRHCVRSSCMMQIESQNLHKTDAAGTSSIIIAGAGGKGVRQHLLAAAAIWGPMRKEALSV